RVPDIGGFDGVPVIEVLVAVGDMVEVDQGLVTLESDKATMEVPSPLAGIIRELKVALGDEIAEGTVVAMIEPVAGDDAAAKADEAKPTAPAAPPRAEPVAESQETRAAETATQVEPANIGSPDKLVQRETAAAAAVPHSPPVTFDADELLPGKVPYASPAVRLFARELGVDRMRVDGSHRGGGISREDGRKSARQASKPVVPAPA